MKIIYDKEDEIHYISESDLLTIGKDLKRFVTIYKKFILIESDYHKDVLNQLFKISDLILSKQYHLLFDHPELEIIKDDENTYDDGLPPF